MALQSDELFKKIEARLATVDPNNRKVLHVYKFVITDDSGKVLKTWILDLKKVKLYQSVTDPAEVTLKLSESTLLQVAARKIELPKVLEDGLATIEGDVKLLLLLKEHYGDVQ